MDALKPKNPFSFEESMARIKEGNLQRAKQVDKTQEAVAESEASAEQARLQARNGWLAKFVPQTNESSIVTNEASGQVKTISTFDANAVAQTTRTEKLAEDPNPDERAKGWTPPTAS